jgi:hypothetical protein
MPHKNNLTRDEATELGSKIGAIVGFGPGWRAAGRGARLARQRGWQEQPLAEQLVSVAGAQ